MNLRAIICAVLVVIAGCKPQDPLSASSHPEPMAKEPVKVLKKWSISTSVDNFTKATKTTATLSSDNKQPVGFSGTQISAKLLIWKNSPANVYPAKIYFSDSSMPRGMNHSGDCYHDNCLMYVKFDDGPIKSYVVWEPESGSSSDQIFTQSKDFVTRALKASKIEVRISFYKQGNGDFIFYNEVPFQWNESPKE